MAFPVIASSNVGSGNPSVVTKPSGLAVGDFMLAIAAIADYSTMNEGITPPTGWVIVRSYTDGLGSSQVTSYYKYATSSDVSATNFTFTTRGSGVIMVGIARITGIDPTTAIIASNDGSGSGSSAVSSGITPTTQALLVMLTGMTKNNNAGTPGVSANAVANNNPTWTSAFTSSSTNTGNQAVVNLTYANMVGAPNTATGNATATLNTSYSSYDLQIIAIQEPVLSPAIFGSTFGFLSFVVNNSFIAAIFGSTFGFLASTAGAVVNKWNNKAKAAPSSVTNKQKTP